MRAAAVAIGAAITVSSRVAVQLGSGLFAVDGSPLADTGTQIGVAAFVISVVYWLLSRQDRMARTQTSTTVAERDESLAELRGRLAEQAERIKSAEEAAGLARDRESHALAELSEAKSQLLVAAHDRELLLAALQAKGG